MLELVRIRGLGQRSSVKEPDADRTRLRGKKRKRGKKLKQIKQPKRQV